MIGLIDAFAKSEDNNIIRHFNGMAGPRVRPWAAKLDMYRKVPGDLLEGSKEGSVISWVAIFTIVWLVFQETYDFLRTDLAEDLYLDHHRNNTIDEDMIHVTFNITMMDLRCDYVEVDAVSVLGNNQNVTKFVQKVPIDAKGILNFYAARNQHQHDVDGPSMGEEVALHDELVYKSIEELEETGQEAVSLDSTTLQYALNEHSLVFVDFFAPWCSHCQMLAPTWEVLAKVMNDATNEDLEDAPDEYDEAELREAERLKVPVLIAKVDCVEHHTLCMEQQVAAYPTLRLFVRGEPFEYGDYRGHRTVMDMVLFLKEAETILGAEGILSSLHKNIQAAVDKHLDTTTEEVHWAEALERTRHHHRHIGTWNPDSHPGCQVSGTIQLNRVPGNFHIQAYSPHHALVPKMTNVSHEIHHLSFAPSEEYSLKGKRRATPVFPPKFFETTHPMDGNVYVTHRLHQAFHHYLKLVTTNERYYQVIQSSQLAEYHERDVPEAKFNIDLSPIAVRYRATSRHWYDFATSLLAIVGGTFTVVGFIEAAFRQAAELHRRQAIQKKR